MLDYYKSLLTQNDNKQCVIILSGGMDSAILARLCVEIYGNNNIHALSFFYKQKQKEEINKAEKLAKILKLKSFTKIDLSFLGDMVRNISSNIENGLETPEIEDILGDPTPNTYVPNRNSIFLMIAVSKAESLDIPIIVTGLQAQDQYGYFDTTSIYVKKMNNVLSEMRKRQVQIIAPFIDINKTKELELLLEMDKNVNLLKHTLTCYNPDNKGNSCGICPSCSERITSFKNLNLIDPIIYSKKINW